MEKLHAGLPLTSGTSDRCMVLVVQRTAFREENTRRRKLTSEPTGTSRGRLPVERRMACSAVYKEELKDQGRWCVVNGAGKRNSVGKTRTI